MKDQTGQQLGNYRLIQQLGHGGFAQVYLGEHVYLRTQAAIKVLQVELAEDGRNQFLDEARTIARLIHPHIIRILDFGVENSDNTPYLVMDYAPNGTLRQRYPKGVQLPLDIIVSYVKQIAEALQYAHTQNVIHRDVKPGNILLGQEQNVFLSDFGIATIAHNSASQSTEDTILGTIAYMAPEQIQGKPRPASDQYALGIVVYEWLCGERPFHGSFTEIVAQQISATPQPLRQRLPQLSADIEEVVNIALAKNPKERFANIDIFAQALQKAASVRPTREYTHLSEVVQPVKPVIASFQSPTFQNTSQQAVSATIQPAPMRSQKRLYSGQAAAHDPALPPTLDTNQPSHRGVTNHQAPTPTDHRKKSRVLGLRAPHPIGLLTGFILFSGLVVLAGHSKALPQVNVTGLSTLTLLNLLADVVLICAAALAGPIAGVLLGSLGYLLGTYINVLTVPGYTLHSLPNYLLGGLIGLLAGLLAYGTLGRHKLSRTISLIVVDIIGAVATVAGIPLALSAQSLVTKVIAILLGLLLVPFFIQLWKATVGHK